MSIISGNSYQSIANAVNKQSGSKVIVQGKQVKISLADLHVFHDENVRDVFDEVGQAHVQKLLNGLKDNKSLKTLTAAPFLTKDSSVGLKLIDGFHSHQASVLFVEYLKEQGIKEKTVGGVKYTDSLDTTLVPLVVENIDEYQQDIYKMTTQYGRKNTDLETVNFITSRMEKYGIPLSQLAKDLGKPESTLKNLLVLKHCLDETKELIQKGLIKGSRVVTLMRFAFKNHNVDLRKKNESIPQDVLEYIHHLVSKEVELNNQADEYQVDTSAATNADTTSEATGTDTTSAATGTDTTSATTGTDTTSAATGTDTTSAATGTDTTSAATGTDTTSEATNADAANEATDTKTAKIDTKPKKKAKKSQLKPKQLSPKKLENLAQLLECIDSRDVEFDEETKQSKLVLEQSILLQISNFRKELDEMVTHNKYVDEVMNNAK